MEHIPCQSPSFLTSLYPSEEYFQPNTITSNLTCALPPSIFPPKSHPSLTYRAPQGPVLFCSFLPAVTGSGGSQFAIMLLVWLTLLCTLPSSSFRFHTCTYFWAIRLLYSVTKKFIFSSFLRDSQANVYIRFHCCRDVFFAVFLTFSHLVTILFLCLAYLVPSCGTHRRFCSMRQFRL